MTTDVTNRDVTTVFAYVAFAAAYAVSGYTSNVLRKETEFRPWKFVKTLLIGVVAGVIMAVYAYEPTGEGYQAATVIAIPIVDQLWNSIGEFLTDREESDDKDD